MALGQPILVLAMRRLERPLAALLILAPLALAAVVDWRGRNVSAVQRGYAVAERSGCFNCHGPGGRLGMPNPGHELGDVPPWSGGLITMYAENEAEVREWILDGMPRRIREDKEQLKLREAAVIQMPAFRGVLRGRELEDVLAYVKAVSDLEKPQDANADDGRRAAAANGCFGCHGPQGRATPPNPGSLKGYIPSWDGPDFPELARDDAEVREWILDGGVKRLASNPAARHFLERQRVKMPAYRGHVKDEEVEQIVAYIRWLRRPQGR
jgi:mono/diheme cytochrome c family protein